MPRRHELQPNRNRHDGLDVIAETFGSLSLSGRGCQSFGYPVSLEPAMSGSQDSTPLEICDQTQVIDDGRHPGLIERLFSGKNYPILGSPDRGEITPASPRQRAELTPVPVTELQVALTQTTVVTPELTERLLLNLANRTVPAALEIVANENEIVSQVVVRDCDAICAVNQIQAHFPDCTISSTNNYLRNLFQNGDSGSLDGGGVSLVISFGLRREMLYSLQTLRSFEPDPLISLITGMTDLRQGERCVFQILFQSTREQWADRVVYNLTDDHGRPRFRESKELLGHAKQKFSRPLLAVAIRVGVIASSRVRAFQIARGIAGTLQIVASPNGNQLIALQPGVIAANHQLESLVKRTSYLEGMLLNVSEVASLAHLPSSSVREPKLKREELTTKELPKMASGNELVLGENYHQGKLRQVTLSNEQRTRHTHLIGSSGSGKSTLMLNLIRQDLEQHQGLCVIDPHGDLIDEVVANIPEHRINDTVLFDPSDSEYPIGFNILQASSELEKTILSSDLTATFRRMSTSWGDVMDSVLANAVLAFLESTRGGSLLELKRFLVEKPFRAEFLESVTDDSIRYFWQHEFPLIAGKPQASILIRLDTFLRQRLIRNIVCQRENKLDLRAIMDNRKILLIKLSQGLIGEENAHLLGTLLVSKIYQTALTRQDTDVRPYFWLYLDEFHHFITPSMEGILSGTRKYHLGLTLAHQEFRQIHSRSQDVASSVLSNCYTRICFRLGDTDAEKFSSGFSFFDAKALQNQGIGEAIGRIERAQHDFNLKVSPVPNVETEKATARREAVVSSTRDQYAVQRKQVEVELFAARIEDTGFGTQKDTLDFQQESFAKKPVTITTGEPRETGNHQHVYLQSIIKRIGERYGFRSVIEKSVFGGAGRVDVALENDLYKIACEIAVTNTVVYETENIKKCLSSGFDKVTVISTDTKHLNEIRHSSKQVLTVDQSSKVHFLEPENFHLFLESLRSGSGNTPAKGSVSIKGYKVESTFANLQDLQAAVVKQNIIEVLSNASKFTREERNG